jgi:hypothetical protein
MNCRGTYGQGRRPGRHLTVGLTGLAVILTAAGNAATDTVEASVTAPPAGPSPVRQPSRFERALGFPVQAIVRVRLAPRMRWQAFE